MMNRSPIDWCDFSWNPITGCLHNCPYCYARKQSKRFCGDIRLNKASPQLRREGDLYVLDKPFQNVNRKVIPLPVGFEPTLHRYRLSMPQEKKLSANIFVGSMADVFGEWVPDEWIHAVIEACEAAPWHMYMFLTKNPGRLPLSSYVYNGVFDAHASNLWFGTTVTDQKSLEKDYKHFANINGNTFLSLEPLHGPIDLSCIDTGSVIYNMVRGMGYYLGGGQKVKNPDWIIIGAETGYRRDKIVPKREWIESIVEQCRAAGVPVFMKRGEKQRDGTYFMEQLMGDQFVQEYPKGLEARRPPLPKHRVFVASVRDKKNCKHCGVDLQGKPATRMNSRYYLCPDCLKEAEG